MVIFLKERGIIMIDVSVIEMLWRFLPAILLVPFITFFLGRLGSNKERKLEYRTFFQVKEMSADYKLTNVPTLKTGTKHLLPKEFESAKEMIDERIKDPSLGKVPKIAYLNLSTFGKSIITGCDIYIKVGFMDQNQKNHELKISLSVLEKDEEIYIPIDSLEMDDGGNMFVKEIRIKYMTQAGEKMLFKSIRRKTDIKDVIVNDKHSVKIFGFFYVPITSSKGNNIGWLVLKGNEKNSD